MKSCTHPAQAGEALEACAASRNSVEQERRRLAGRGPRPRTGIRARRRSDGRALRGRRSWIRKRRGRDDGGQPAFWCRRGRPPTLDVHCAEVRPMSRSARMLQRAVRPLPQTAEQHGMRDCVSERRAARETRRARVIRESTLRVPRASGFANLPRSAVAIASGVARIRVPHARRCPDRR